MLLARNRVRKMVVLVRKGLLLVRNGVLLVSKWVSPLFQYNNTVQWLDPRK